MVRLSHRRKSPPVTGLLVGGLAVLFSGCGLSPVPTAASHHVRTALAPKSRHTSTKNRRPPTDISKTVPPTILGKETELMAYQPRALRQEWVSAGKPAIYWSSWVGRSSTTETIPAGQQGTYYFLVQGQQVPLQVYPRLPWSGPITAAPPSPSTGLAAFDEQSVTFETPASTPSILPRDYPLESNPVEFFTPHNFTMVQAIAEHVAGASVAVQIFTGTTTPVLALAVSDNGILVMTHISTNPITVAALTGQSMLVESLPAHQVRQWYRIDLLTGALTALGTTPSGWSSTNPDIQGIAPGTPQTTLSPNPNAASLSANVTGSSLVDVLVRDVNTMLLTALTPHAVTVTQSSATQATLAPLSPMRWKSVTFRNQNGTWTPTHIETTLGSLTLTYDMTGQAVVMPQAEMQSVEQAMASQSYSALDTQTGALARLPIDLEGAVVQGPENLPKIGLVDQGRTLLGFTYTASDQGQAVYVPIGWWCINPPSILPSTASTPPPSASPSTSASAAP